MSSLRRRLAEPGPVLVAGAHSALTAKLVEEAGFDAIWASGFEISAARGVPDANILTMVEQLDAARHMVAAVSIPVIADCDGGFGNAINVDRMTREYEQAGVAGICLEDNVFPKRCSFYVGVRRELTPIDEHAGKIRAAISARSSRDTLVIARTEALIAGFGMHEAVSRAHAYADAGADLILVHSKADTADELEEFSRRWHRRVPLVCVPTCYKHASADELDALGFKVVIFANHALRASVKAVQTTLAALRAERRPAAADPYIVPMEEIYRLVGVDDLRSREHEFLPANAENIRAVILAAGADNGNLLPLTEDRPKCMLDVKGRTILDRQIEILNSFGIREIAVVRGYRKERVNLPNLTYFDNDEFASTGELESLFAAREFLDGRTLILYGDILFEKHALERLLRSHAPITAVIDRSWVDHRGATPLPGAPDLVRLRNHEPSVARQLSIDVTATVTEIARSLDPHDADGEFIGMMMLAPEATARVCELWDRVSTAAPATFHEADSSRRASLTDLLSALIADGEEVAAVEIYKGWMEVDSFEDYRRMWADAP